MRLFLRLPVSNPSSAAANQPPNRTKVPLIPVGVTGRLNQPKALRRLEIDGPPVEPFECGLRVVPAIQAKRVAIEKPGRSGGLRLGARASTGLASAGRGVKHPNLL